MSEAAVKRMTLAEFLCWEDGTDTRYELLAGQPVARSLPRVAHGVPAARICGAVGSRPQSGRTWAARRQGFYDYPPDSPKRLWPGLSQLALEAETPPSIDEIKTRYLAIQALAAARCLEENVVTDPADADVGALLGSGFAPWTGGPLSYIDMLGAGSFVELCDRLAQQHSARGFCRARCCATSPAGGGTIYAEKAGRGTIECHP